VVLREFLGRRFGRRVEPVNPAWSFLAPASNGGSVTSSLSSPVIVLRTVHDRLGDLQRFVDTHLFDNLAGDGLDTVVFDVKVAAVRDTLLYTVSISV
jgi:hypothetical protein